MPRFSYKAKEGPGKVVDGFIEAESLDLAIQKVIQSGFTPIDVAQADQSKREHKKEVKQAQAIFKKVKLKDAVLFTRQMSDLVDASVPILRALQIVSRQIENIHFKEMVDQMYTVVSDGGSFSSALAQHKNVFSNLYIELVKTGEVSGQLSLILNRLADYMENEQEIRSKVKASLAYPMFILGVGIVTIFVLLSFVIPRLALMFDDLGQELPWQTLLLTNVSGIFSQFWWLMLIIVAILGLYFISFISSASGRLKVDTFLLKVPLIGEFIRLVELARVSRTLATLVDSGVPITTALNSVWATVENSALKSEMIEVPDDVANGTSLNVALGKCSFFPDMALNMVSVGEETGQLHKSFYKIADTYERQTDRIIKTIISLLGPIVLVFIVTIVGFVVIAMLLPIFKMNLIIQ